MTLLPAEQNFTPIWDTAYITCIFQSIVTTTSNHSKYDGTSTSQTLEVLAVMDGSITHCVKSSL